MGTNEIPNQPVSEDLPSDGLTLQRELQAALRMVRELQAVVAAQGRLIPSLIHTSV